jgi:hypothetical protein
MRAFAFHRSHSGSMLILAFFMLCLHTGRTDASWLTLTFLILGKSELWEQAARDHATLLSLQRTYLCKIWSTFPASLAARNDHVTYFQWMDGSTGVEWKFLQSSQEATVGNPLLLHPASLHLPVIVRTIKLQFVVHTLMHACKVS